MKKFLQLIVLLVTINVAAQAQGNIVGSGIDLSFPGTTGNYVDLGDIYNTMTFPFTFEAWVNPTSYPTANDGIYSSDNDILHYNGFWIYRFHLSSNAPGVLRIEFGNGGGAGYQYRRGFQTSVSFPLERWTHIAVVCNSMTDIHMYFNGVEQGLLATDGTSSATAITHTSYAASIGRFQNPNSDSYFAGQMDEIRLWTVARSITDLRDNMCRKVSNSSSGLVGYWKGDNSYTSNTVKDYANPAENGTITGTIGRLTSGAPLGDASANNYPGSWNGVSVYVNASNGDRLTASSITNAPYGVQVYRVDYAPYSTTGLLNYAPYYFGVFCAEGSNVASYKAAYKYSTLNGTTTTSNESLATVFKRTDGSITSWTNMNGSVDTVANKISKGNQSSRREYILNIPVAREENENISLLSNNELNVLPNPTSNQIAVQFSKIGEAISSVRIININGQVVFEQNNISKELPLHIDVSDFAAGVYFVNVVVASGNFNSKFVVQK